MKYLKEFRECFKNLPSFTVRDALLFLVKKGSTKEYAYLFLHNLLEKNELKRITKGVYTFKEETQVVGLAFQPYYYGLQDALSLQDAWEQETNPLVITPRKVRTGVRNFLGNNYVVRRIDRKMFFGFHAMKYGDFWINVSDLEKTLIDFAYFREPLAKEAIEEIKPKLDKIKLSEYLEKSPKRVKELVRRFQA